MNGFFSDTRRALVHPLISKSILLGTLIVQLVLSPIAAQGQGRTGTPLDESSSSPSEWTNLELSEEDTALLEDKMDELVSSALATFVENNPEWEIFGPTGEALRGEGMLSSLRTLRSIREAIESDESGESNEDDKTPILSFGTPNLEDEKGRYIIELNRPEIEKEKAQEVLEKGKGTIQAEIDLSARFLSQNHPIVLTASRNVEVNIPIGKKEAEMEEISQKNLKEIEDSLISMMGELDQRNRALFPKPKKETKETSLLIQQKILNLAGSVLNLLVPSAYSGATQDQDRSQTVRNRIYFVDVTSPSLMTVRSLGLLILCFAVIGLFSLFKFKTKHRLITAPILSFVIFTLFELIIIDRLDLWYSFKAEEEQKEVIKMSNAKVLPISDFISPDNGKNYSIDQISSFIQEILAISKQLSDLGGKSLVDLFKERENLLSVVNKRSARQSRTSAPQNRDPSKEDIQRLDVLDVTFEYVRTLLKSQIEHSADNTKEKLLNEGWSLLAQWSQVSRVDSIEAEEILVQLGSVLDDL